MLTSRQLAGPPVVVSPLLALVVGPLVELVATAPLLPLVGLLPLLLASPVPLPLPPLLVPAVVGSLLLLLLLVGSDDGFWVVLL